jgi:pimeloyl-ACP methyl ester carboxylesterase
MKPWPSLASYGKILSIPGGKLFYYDSAGNADSAGNTGSSVDNGKLTGTPKGTLVLIHGLGDEADTWRHIFPVFTAEGYRVIAPDLPGFGRSLWKGRINIYNHCRAVIRLLISIGAAQPGSPALIAGSSLGAGIAELIACKRPDLVKALVLIDGCFPFNNSMNNSLFLLALPFIGKGWYRSFRKNHEAAWKSLYPYYGNLDAMNGEDKDFLRERVIARITSPNQERGYFATLRSMNVFFLFGTGIVKRKIRFFPGKILIIWGEKDLIFPREKTAVFHSLRPDADIAVIAGAGHWPHQEKPVESAAEMLRFLLHVFG